MEPFQREILETIRRHYPRIGHQLCAASLIEVLGIQLHALLSSEPHRRDTFVTSLRDLLLMVETHDGRVN